MVRIGNAEGLNSIVSKLQVRNVYIQNSISRGLISTDSMGSRSFFKPKSKVRPNNSTPRNTARQRGDEGGESMINTTLNQRSCVIQINRQQGNGACGDGEASEGAEQDNLRFGSSMRW